MVLTMVVPPKAKPYTRADDQRSVEVGGAMDTGEDTGTVAEAYPHPSNGGGSKMFRGFLHVSRQWLIRSRTHCWDQVRVSPPVHPSPVHVRACVRSHVRACMRACTSTRVSNM